MRACPLPPPHGEPPLPATSASLPGQHWQDGTAQACTDTLVEEVPVALVYNGISHAVMLATPADLEDFALGFSLAEGILQRPAELYDVEAVGTAQGIELRLEIAAARQHALQARRRSLAGRTGCGLCGVDSLAQAGFAPTPVPAVAPIPAALLGQALGQLQQHQHLHQSTGGAHAAAWLARDGGRFLLREDVGRHNALDKLVGALHRQGLRPAEGIAVVTSRASVELVHKAASAGIPLLAAMSAPTAAAVRLADACGLALAGWAREGRHTLYSHPATLQAP